jgi:hypothetical protein
VRLLHGCFAAGMSNPIRTHILHRTNKITDSANRQNPQSKQTQLFLNRRSTKRNTNTETMTHRKTTQNQERNNHRFCPHSQPSLRSTSACTLARRSNQPPREEQHNRPGRLSNKQLPIPRKKLQIIKVKTPVNRPNQEQYDVKPLGQQAST